MDFLCTLKIKIESKNSDNSCIKDWWPYRNQDQDTKHQSGTSSGLQSSKWGLRGHGCSLHLQDWGPKFGSWLYEKTSDHIQIKNKMLSPSPEPPASSKVPNEELKDMGVLCTFKIKVESKNLYYGCIKKQLPYQNKNQDTKPHSGTSSSLKSPKWGLKGHGCSLHLQK